jgi:hypothetical protein
LGHLWEYGKNSEAPFLRFYRPAIASEKVVVPVGAGTRKKNPFSSASLGLTASLASCSLLLA